MMKQSTKRIRLQNTVQKYSEARDVDEKKFLALLYYIV